MSNSVVVMSLGVLMLNKVLMHIIYYFVSVDYSIAFDSVPILVKYVFK